MPAVPPSKLLNDLASLLGSVGATRQANGLRDLAVLLTDTKSAKALLKAKPPGGDSESDLVRAVRAAIEHSQKLLANVSSRAGADLQLAGEILKGSQHTAVADFVREAAQWPSLAAKGKRGSGATAPASAGLRLDLVRRYVDRLLSSSNDNFAFDQIMAGLRSDKQMRVAEVQEIALRYVGVAPAKKSGRAGALRAIVENQALKARQAARAPHQF